MKQCIHKEAVIFHKKVVLSGHNQFYINIKKSRISYMKYFYSINVLLFQQLLPPYEQGDKYAK